MVIQADLRDPAKARPKSLTETSIEDTRAIHQLSCPSVAAVSQSGTLHNFSEHDRAILPLHQCPDGSWLSRSINTALRLACGASESR